MDGTCEVRYTRYYRAAPDEVWAAVTEPESLARWLAPTGEVALRRGGPFELELDRGTMKGRVRTVEPFRLLELDWIESDGPPSILRFELSSDDGGTMLVLDHRRIDARIGMRYMTRWGDHLGRLDGVVEG